MFVRHDLNKVTRFIVTVVCLAARSVEKKPAEKMTYKEKLELENLNKSMPLLEDQKSVLTEKLNNPDLKYDEILALSEQ